MMFHRDCDAMQKMTFPHYAPFVREGNDEIREMKDMEIKLKTSIMLGHKAQ